jgi:hypothetical protein
MPGKALKLDDAQKKVSSHSLTKMQLGSGWKPGKMGLRMVLLPPQLEAAEMHVTREEARTASVRRIATIFSTDYLEAVRAHVAEGVPLRTMASIKYTNTGTTSSPHVYPSPQLWEDVTSTAPG